MPGTQASLDGVFDSVTEVRRKRLTVVHDEEEEYVLIAVLWSSTADAKAVGDCGVEGYGFDYGVDFAGAEANS